MVLLGVAGRRAVPAPGRYACLVAVGDAAGVVLHTVMGRPRPVERDGTRLVPIRTIGGSTSPPAQAGDAVRITYLRRVLGVAAAPARPASRHLRAAAVPRRPAAGEARATR